MQSLEPAHAPLHFPAAQLMSMISFPPARRESISKVLRCTHTTRAALPLENSNTSVHLGSECQLKTVFPAAAPRERSSKCLLWLYRYLHSAAWHWKCTLESCIPSPTSQKGSCCCCWRRLLLFETHSCSSSKPYDSIIMYSTGCTYFLQLMS